MEQLVKSMQHPQTGVPVKSQKLFLTTVPSAFTGEDLIEWLSNRLDIKDSGLFNSWKFTILAIDSQKLILIEQMKPLI
jgi:hypothetical protein